MNNLDNLDNLDNNAISREAFNWIQDTIPKGSTILEFGSGTGTIELSKLYNVITIEQDEKWLHKAILATYIYAPIKNGWYDENIVFDNIGDDYKLIIIDGPWGTNLRPGIDKHWHKFNTDIPLLFDDTHRQEDRDHAISVAKQLNKSWEEIIGWQKNFIVVKNLNSCNL